MSKLSVDFYARKNIEACRLATTADLGGFYNNVDQTLINSGTLSQLSVDLTNVNLGDRICVRSQGNSFENGIYNVLSVGSTFKPWILQRSNDFRSSAQITPGLFFIIADGNTAKGNLLGLSSAQPRVVGIDEITFIASHGSIFLLPGNILVGNAESTAIGVEMTGNVAIDETGQTSISSLVPFNSEIATPNSASGYLSSSFRFINSGGASENVDITVPFDIKVIKCLAVPQTNGAANQTLTLTDGTNDITNTIGINFFGGTILEPTSIDPTFSNLTSGSTLRAAYDDGGGGPIIPVVEFNVDFIRT